MWDSEGILDNWKTYCERLYSYSRTPEINQPVSTFEVIDDDEPSIILDEVREVVNGMKKCKAPGCDSIEAELWQTDFW